jgi:hypothetical protein
VCRRRQKPGAPFIEIDIFQGDSEFIVDNEYLGTVKLPAATTGKRIDFAGRRGVPAARVPRRRRRPARGQAGHARHARDPQEGAGRGDGEALGQQEERDAAEKGGLFSSIKRLLGGG